MTDPIFFFTRRTARQLRVHTATDFHADGTYMPMRGNHPQAEEATYVLNAFTIVARDLPVSMVTADALVAGAARYMMPDVHARLRVIPSTGKLPRRIVLKGA